MAKSIVEKAKAREAEKLNPKDLIKEAVLSTVTTKEVEQSIKVTEDRYWGKDGISNRILKSDDPKVEYLMSLGWLKELREDK